MVNSQTLVIKHLPNELDDKEKEEFLRYFGAKEVKCLSSKHNKYNIAFASFENENIAENVLHRLHQVDILGSCLSVEFTKNGNLHSALPNKNPDCAGTKEDKENEKYYKQFIEKLTMWHTGVNFKQPVPCHLKYQYPPPNVQVLINIIKVLVTVPKFYTQVLHLMNKMNLPCPFGKDVLPDLELDIYPLNKNEFLDKKTDTVNVMEEFKKAEELKTTSESEISTDEELKTQKEKIPEKHKLKKKTKIKVSKFLKPTPLTVQKTKKAKFEEVFEKHLEEKEPKKIKLSYITPTPDQVTSAGEKVTEPIASSSGFGYIHPVKKTVDSELVKDVRDEREEERIEREPVACISEKELFENRISEKDRTVLPVFKNYAEGAPTCRLYIKNLAKTVKNDDLAYIYSRYRTKSVEGETNMFDIRLMQEGRMKGQAFITFETVELAQKALKETNGYILKEKPLVVQFARSSTK